ncbi:hypothetical protein ACFZDJ_51575 [Streptomyces sp. NPDC007896]|uniref:hypothetical protein n=1 Tax=Streptomyces sp. NPDC007896 TaxID=3364784 RepID=UPI0036F09E24
MTLPTPPVRCDNALPGTSKIGCVMPNIPEMVYAKNGPYPELAKHIEYAQNTKNLPGKHSTQRYLTRLTNQTKITQNRKKACPSSRRLINATRNEDGGRALKNFYGYNRIIEKDKFLVWIK